MFEFKREVVLSPGKVVTYLHGLGVGVIGRAMANESKAVVVMFVRDLLT